MKLFIPLLFIPLLSYEVQPLLCHQCVSMGLAPCTSTQINCSGQCASATVSVYTGQESYGVNMSVQSCSSPDTCVNGSLNAGTMNVMSSAKCCGTDLCNNKTLPASRPQSPNGMKCYTCDPNGCSGTLKCVGDQNRCITSSVQQGSSKVSMKGCASKSICDLAKPISGGIASTNVACCEGNLCNAAELFTPSFLLMLGSSLSSVLLY